MKESDESSSNQESGSQNAKPANGKAEKDMKGLVYQGDDQPSDTPSQEDSYTAEPASEGEEKPAEDKMGEPGEPSTKQGSEDILTFTEKDNKAKLIIIAAIAIIIIVAVGYLFLHGAKPSKSVTTTVTTKNSVTVKSSTTTVPRPLNPNKTRVLNIDQVVNYNGPTTVNKTRCTYTTQDRVFNYNARFNASSKFYLPENVGGLSYINSNTCPRRITRIVTSTPGFSIVSISPSLPQNLPPNSAISFNIQVQTPAFNYTGPLVITYYTS
ncbi:MAG: hypothetical protein KGH94_02130 [Candidatus Micrarchaeota archaeon]|nr:hypothetical protein [Candidatus Micrarchaeota archaeon]